MKALQTPGFKWTAKELEKLLDTIDLRLPVRVYLNNSAEAIYTSILGMDLNRGELLLDTLHPMSFYDLIVHSENRSDLTLALSDAGNSWFLDCEFRQVDNSNAHYVVCVKLKHSRKTPGRRFHQRVFFNGKRPEIQFSPNWSPALKAQLLDLSPYGCQIQVLGDDVRKKMSSRLSHLHLKFNEEFVLECRSEIKQIQFLRKPCCHNRIRLMFRQLDPLQLEQLHTFVNSYSLECVA